MQVVANESGRRVDITIDGKPFTSYIYPEHAQEAGALSDSDAPSGTLVTRGFPLDPRPRERFDHPHHVGLWFNHGDVNGLDFWNNSYDIPADRAPKMGTIHHKRVVEAKSGADRGELAVEMEWKTADGVALLRETTRFVFRGAGDARSIDRITTLTALDQPRRVPDNKEGTLGLRVTRELEQPADKPELFTDASGKVTNVPVLDNTGVTGLYTSSEGLKGDAVWGTRGRWCMLGGKIGAEPVTHRDARPSLESELTHLLARARLRAVRGQRASGARCSIPTQEELTLTLEPGKSVTYRHRVLILGNTATARDD